MRNNGGSCRPFFLFLVAVIADGVQEYSPCVYPDIPTATCIIMTLIIFLPYVAPCHFLRAILHCCTHAANSASFAATQLGADDNQLLLAWIAMRIPFPIGAPVHSICVHCATITRGSPCSCYYSYFVLNRGSLCSCYYSYFVLNRGSPCPSYFSYFIVSSFFMTSVSLTLTHISGRRCRR